ncbi:MAG TPA: excinuclease ABC subunit UvrC [Chitinophagaceae bacterium]|nr:excinuclease ABC subunit UvrC [Chitinophagaceae bacterium]
MTSAEFSKISSSIPNHPGIYKYFDEKNILLYVGKAKNLKKRVSSYFTKTFTSYKTHELVQRIHHIEFTIVNSEQDAFLLENSLIKQFQPRYNINLKDDKTYPYIVIKHEPFPRVFLTRRLIHDGSEYLGPFTSVNKVRELIEFIKQNIPLRTCKLNLTEQNIQKGKFKVCLEYHLGNCKGPCEGFQTRQDYDEGLSQIRNFLKGNLAPVIQHFKNQMKEFASSLEFEKAEMMRKKIEHLQNYKSRSTVVNPKLGDMDVCSIAGEENEKSYVNFMMVRNGAIVDSKTVLMEKKLEEGREELLAFALLHFRELFASEAKEIILPLPIEFPGEDLTITVPKGGDKKKLLELSEKNVNYFIEDQKRQNRLLLTKADRDMSEVLLQLQDDLNLQELPNHIECFDNSNFHGSYPVSAMVCFKDGKPSKKDYRHFNVKTVEGINDFATMKEVVGRRYKRLVADNSPLPQLVIIDGGKGQLNAALEAVEELGISGRMTLVGLAKNVEEIFFAQDQESLKLPYGSSSLNLIRYIRDEVHRFGISFHRQKRAKGTFKNELEGIKGIGSNTADTLLKTFRSVNNIIHASEEELEQVVGAAKAKLIRKHFGKM